MFLADGTLFLCVAELGRDALSVQAAPHDPGFGLHELGGGARRVAPLLAAPALVRTPAQLHGAPVRGRGGHQHGPAHPAQLRGEPPEAVLVVGHHLLLHYLPALRHLLEHLRLRAFGRPDPAAPLMKACPSFILTFSL